MFRVLPVPHHRAAYCLPPTAYLHLRNLRMNRSVRLTGLGSALYMSLMSTASVANLLDQSLSPAAGEFAYGLGT